MGPKMSSSPLINLVSKFWFSIHIVSDSLFLTGKMVSQLSYSKMLFLCQPVERFTIERVNKSGAVFDSTKLRYVLHFPYFI